MRASPWLIGMLFVSGQLLAHGDEKHDKEGKHAPAAHAVGEHAHKAPHGGTVVSQDAFHLELVTSDQGVDVYLLDDKEATLPVARMQEVKLTIQAKGKKRELPLSAGKEAWVSTTPVAKPFVAVMTGKIDGKPVTVRFKVK